MKQPCVYIMASKRHGTLYIGVTSDLPRRAFDHREGLVKGFTKKYDCKTLVWYELHETIDRGNHSGKANQGREPCEETGFDRGAESRMEGSL